MHLSKLHLLLALLLTCLFMPGFALAQEPKIGVVDVDVLISESEAGKSIRKQLDGRREAFQKEFSDREIMLRESEKKLLEKKQNMSPEAFAKERDAFDAQLRETQELFQKRRNALDKGLSEATTELRKNMVQVTAEIADNQGYTMVLNRESVVILEKGLDITQEVLKSLNAKVKEIKLDVK